VLQVRVSFPGPASFFRGIRKRFARGDLEHRCSGAAQLRRLRRVGNFVVAGCIGKNDRKRFEHFRAPWISSGRDVLPGRPTDLRLGEPRLGRWE